MAKTLSIELPEEVYQAFLQIATRSGQTPEAIVGQWIVSHHQSQISDPLDSFIGAFASGIPEKSQGFSHG
jgi:predicted transcriptional regulator